MPKNTNDITYRSYRTGSFQRKMAHIFARKKLVYSYLAEIYYDRNGFDALGFKFMYDQARRSPEVIHWCRDFNVKVIHLIRRNALKMIVSRQVARQRGIYLSMKQLRPTTVKLDASNLIVEIQKLEAMVERNRETFAAFPYMEIFYEDFMANHDDHSKGMLNFLHTDAEEQLTCDLMKTSADSLDTLIGNYEDVRKILAGSPYEQFLD